jgi:hypothetical protein
MNVLLLEMGGSHIECMYSYLHLLKIKNHQVHLACNEKLVALFPEQDQLDGLLILNNQFSFSEQIKAFFQIRGYIQKNNITHLIINTCELKIIRNLFLFIPKKINCTGLVHNARKIEKSVTFTKLLSIKMKKYLVLGDFLLKNIQPFYKFQVQSFYPIYFPKAKNNSVQKPNGAFWICIPGGASHERRDYLLLIEALSKMSLPIQIKFIFLGKYYLNEVVDKSTTESEWWKNHIITFDEEVPYDIFHQYIQQSDFILPLIKMENDTMYGLARISGSFNLGLGYKKPFLLPENYQANTDLLPYSLYYKNINHLLDLIAENYADKTTIDLIQQKYNSGPFKDFNLMSEQFCSFIQL